MEEPTKINYIVFSIVSKVEERFANTYIEGVGPSATFKQLSLGWYMHLNGSWEAIYMGAARPEFNVGDKVKIIFERL